MTNKLPLPSPHEKLPLPELRAKGQWVGFLTTVIGVAVQLGVLLGIPVAKRFMSVYSTLFGWQPGILWHPPGEPPGDSLRLHERVHAWHINRVGRLRYCWLWVWHRDECEGLAYAAQAVAGLRSVTSVVESLVHPNYGLGWSTGEVRVLVLESMIRWREAGWTRERMLEEATRE